jgi:DNA-binding transcriptional regulator YiaG
MQVLYRRKYMDRHDYPTEDAGYSTGLEAEVVEQSPGVKAAPERERIKDDSGRLNYRKIASLLRERYQGGTSELARKMDVSRSSVYRWMDGTNEPSKTHQKGLRRKARSQGIGHYRETEDGSGEAADDVRYIDADDERRTLVEYVDVPWDWDIGGDDREYALLNIHTGSYNANHTDQQLHQIHDEVADRAMQLLSPTNDQGQTLDLDAQNTHFSTSGWSRERDSMNWERELLDDGEEDVYVGNLPSHPDKPDEPAKYPLVEIIVWNEDMTGLEWQVIGVWTGDSVGDMTVLKDTQGWWG